MWVLETQQYFLPIPSFIHFSDNLLDCLRHLFVAPVGRQGHDFVLWLFELSILLNQRCGKCVWQQITHLQLSKLLHQRLSIFRRLPFIPPSLPEKPAPQSQKMLTREKCGRPEAMIADIFEQQRRRRNRHRLFGHRTVGHDVCALPEQTDRPRNRFASDAVQHQANGLRHGEDNKDEAR